MDKQYCPICSSSVEPNKRYPRYVCSACAAKASSPDGRLLEFGNTDIGGGFVVAYADNGAEYRSHDCYIDNIKCYANEARFGGIVIEVVRVRTPKKSLKRRRRQGRREAPGRKQGD
jgi:hypothetical protein